MKRKQKLPAGVRMRTRKDGSCVFDALVWVKGKQQMLGAHASAEEALAVRHAYFVRLSQAGEDVPYDTGILTVRQIGYLYLDSLPETAQRTDRNRWKARVEQLSEFIDWPVSQVDEDAVKRWVHAMCTTPIASGKSAGQLPARTTIQNSLNLLRDAFRWAGLPSNGYVTSNPAKSVTIRDSTVRAPKVRQMKLFDYLREDEARKLIETDAIELEPKTKFLTLMFSGARPSDVWRLEWDRVDLNNETILFGSKKTSRSYLVHMLPQLANALRKWWLASGRPNAGLIFPNSEGEVYAAGYDAGWADRRGRKHWTWDVKGAWTRTAEAAGERRRNKSQHVKVTPGYRTKIGIRRNVPLYSLKHTCACHLLLGTELFTGGRRWSREEIQAQLGHTSSKTTEHYMVALGLASRKAAEDSREALTALRNKRQK